MVARRVLAPDLLDGLVFREPLAAWTLVEG